MTELTAPGGTAAAWRVFTRGCAHPSITLQYNVPNAETAGYSFALILQRPDDTSVTIPGVFVSESDYCTVYNFPWVLGTKALVTADLTVAASTTIPTGSRIANTDGDVFLTLAPAVNGAGIEAVVAVACEALFTGNPSVAVGVVTVIPTAITGLVSVTNLLVGTVGIDPTLYKGTGQCLYGETTFPDSSCEMHELPPLDVVKHPLEPCS